MKPLIIFSTLTRSELTINRVLYIFYFGAFGISLPYLNLYYREFGLTGFQIGLINTLAPFMGMLGGPFWGTLADRFGHLRYFLGLAATGAVIAALSLSFARSFPNLLLIAAIQTFFFAPIMPLLDSLTLQILGRNREFYGRQRIWGSIGFIITSLIFGFLFERIGLHWLFYGFSLIMLAFLFTSFWLPSQEANINLQIRHNFISLIKKPNWLFFTMSILILGIGNSGMNNFLGVYLKEMGAKETLIGSVSSLGTLTELPIMFFSANLIARIGSRRMLGLAFLMFSIRWVLYGIMPTFEWAVPITLLHGFSFGFYWIASVAYANELAPENFKSTAQGLFAGTLNLTGILGALIGGVLFDRFGPSKQFIFYGCLGLFALVFLWQGKVKNS